MTRKQLYTLFICQLVINAAGAAFIPLLPVYGAQLGAGATLIGYYMAFAYLALTLGTLAGGWLSDRFQRTKLPLIASGAVGVLAVVMMGVAADIWQLALGTATLWFVGGMGYALTNTLTGMLADEGERGKAFGILGLSLPLANIIGGLAAGAIADRWGYPTLFATVALVVAVLPFAGLLLQDRPIARTGHVEASTEARLPGLTGAAMLLVLSQLLAAIAGFAGNIGRSLAMRDLGFSSAAISSTAAVRGLVLLPLPLLIGWLSDRVGRKVPLAMCYLAGAAALWVLASAGALWHFWVGVALIGVISAGTTVGRALVTDLLPERGLGRGMSLYGAAGWGGAIIGFAATGQVAERLGMSAALAVGAVLPIVAILLVIPIREAKRMAGVQSAQHQ